MKVDITDIELARERLRGVVKPTPLMRSATLDRMVGAEVFLKPENLQKTGSFKIRGAYNRIATFSADEAKRGVVTASAGNHGQALAYAASLANVKATIVMPKSAAISKINATTSYGPPQLVLEGIDYQAALQAAEQIGARTGAVFVDAYDNPLVIAGQGTVGLEILDELEPDVVLAPCGGGGLLAGLAVALRARAPRTELIGVEAAASPQLSLSLAARAPVAVRQPVYTIADGLATGQLGRLPFELICGHVSRVVSVDDFAIGEAVLLMLERAKLLIEGAGAVALSGALQLSNELKGRKVVVVLTGGNIDINLLDRIIGHGLVKVGRLFHLAVDLRDRPGELGKLLTMLSETGANVHRIDHERTGRDVPISSARVMLELETRGPEHIAAIRDLLDAHGYRLIE